MRKILFHFSKLKIFYMNKSFELASLKQWIILNKIIIEMTKQTITSYTNDDKKFL